MAANGNIPDPDVLKKYQELIKKGHVQTSNPLGPGGWIPANKLINPTLYGPGGISLNPNPGRPVGSVLKDKDTIVQETVERLAEVIAKICNRYNLSESVQMQTEIDLVETANYTTVILTATIEWLPNPYVFVAQEKVKTSNKTAQNKPNIATTGAIGPAPQAPGMSTTDWKKQIEYLNKYLGDSSK